MGVHRYNHMRAGGPGQGDNDRVRRPWRRDRLPMLLDALGAGEEHPAVLRLVDALGGAPASVDERLVDEPGHVSRRLSYASGGEIVLHDDVVVAVVLNVRPTPFAPHGCTLREWVAGVGNDATLDDLRAAVGGRPGFVHRDAYFERDGGYVRCSFDEEGWRSPGHLTHVTVTIAHPGRTCQPDDDICSTCGDAVVRHAHTGDMDLDATVDALAAAVTAQQLTEGASLVPLADLRMLQAAGLMERVESQLTCTRCRRVVCLTTYRDRAATLVHAVYGEAMQRPMEAIPPVEQWGDADRVAAAAHAMRYVDHHTGLWSLVEHESGLYLQSRYWRNQMVDASCLIRLDESEVEGYRAGGHEYLSRLARRIDGDHPWDDESHYGRRNINRDPHSSQLAQEVDRALVNHTWLAEQRQALHRRITR